MTTLYERNLRCSAECISCRPPEVSSHSYTWTVSYWTIELLHIKTLQLDSSDNGQKPICTDGFGILPVIHSGPERTYCDYKIWAG